MELRATNKVLIIFTALIFTTVTLTAFAADGDNITDDPVPSVKYLKEDTKITWESKNLKAFDTYKFEW